MSVTRVSATEAARTFSDLLNRIRYRGEEFAITAAELLHGPGLEVVVL